MPELNGIPIIDADKKIGMAQTEKEGLVILWDRPYRGMINDMLKNGYILGFRILPIFNPGHPVVKLPAEIDKEKLEKLEKQEPGLIWLGKENNEFSNHECELTFDGEHWMFSVTEGHFSGYPSVKLTNADIIRLFMTIRAKLVFKEEL